MSDNIYELGQTEDQKVQENNNNKSNKEHISIDEFYTVMVKDWRNSKIDSYEIYLQQGNIPAGALYNLLGLEPFQKPTDDDKKRLENIRAELQKEADKFLRVDGEKRDALVQAIGFLFAIMLNDKRHDSLCEVLKKSTWARLSTVIADKCSDGIVELSEMNDIYNMARELGLFAPSLKDNTINEITTLITNSNSKIENVSGAFKTYYEDYLKQNVNNDLDTETNRNKLLAKFIELKKIENNIVELPDLTDDEYREQFDEFLEDCDIELIKPYEKFEKTFFNDFKNSHDLSMPLKSMDYVDLKSSFTSFGFTEESWEKFEKDNNITVEQEISEREFKKLQADKEKFEKQIKNNKKSGIKIPILILKIIPIILVAALVVYEAITIPKIYKEAQYWIEEGNSKATVFHNVVHVDDFDVVNSWIATRFLKADWKANAVKNAIYYANENYSEEEIRENLKDIDKFKNSEIDYAIEKLNYSVEYAKELANQAYSEEEIRENMIESNEFTEEEIDYALLNFTWTGNKNALHSAESIAQQNKSKQEVRAELESLEFPESDIDEAMSLLNWDWNENALAKARNWASLMYSKEGVRSMLLNENLFEQSEVEYAMNNIEYDWNNNALVRAQNYANFNCTDDDIREKLSVNDSFEESEIEYAIKHLER